MDFTSSATAAPQAGARGRPARSSAPGPLGIRVLLARGGAHLVLATMAGIGAVLALVLPSIAGATPGAGAIAAALALAVLAWLFVRAALRWVAVLQGSLEWLARVAAGFGSGERIASPDDVPLELAQVAAALTGASRLLHVRTCQRDRLQRENDSLRIQAHRDGLTLLENRSRFLETLGERVEAQRRVGGVLSVLYIDIDDFKPVNDHHGHAAGDQLLRAFGARLRAAIRAQDAAARLGGDEFALLLDGLAPARAERLARGLLDQLLQPYSIDGQQVLLSLSVGIAGFPADAADPPALLDAADRAMYRAKETGKQRAVARRRPDGDGATEPGPDSRGWAHTCSAAGTLDTVGSGAAGHPDGDTHADAPAYAATQRMPLRAAAVRGGHRSAAPSGACAGD